jgi:hypothetical protein
MDGVDTYLATYPESPIVLDVLGTADADEIRARAFDLDPEAVEIFFFAASVGALFGIRRRDGTRVAMKVHKLFDDEAFHDEVQRVQAALRPLGAPRPLGRRGLVTFEEWLDAGSFRNPHEPEVRRALAGVLARFVETATATGLRPRRPFLRPHDALWPKPHNVLFDFEATTAGAEWIDAIATAARAVTDEGAGREVVGHADWAAKHVRFDDRLRATAIYDWDSVTTDTEPSLVGTAAGSYLYLEEHDLPRWPTPEQARAFVAEYEAARGEPFTGRERRATYAACVYLVAYAARCGHAFGGDGRDVGLETLADALLRDGVS